MELYKRFPVLCTVWAFLEVLCFGGVLFGWGSLVFILKEEGFYLDLCITDNQRLTESHSNFTGVPIIAKQSITLNKLPTTINTSVSNVDSSVYDISNVQYATNASLNDTQDPQDSSQHEGTKFSKECKEQAAQLNLWFSASVSFMYLAFTGVGFLTKKLGTRLTRCMFIVIYVTGALCIAFATPGIPWLLLPGLCCIGIAGLGTLATNLQVADLHPHIRSTIVAIFTGLFDFSTILQQVVKIAYENGIPRRTSYIFIAVSYTVLVSISTFFFLPRKRITEEHVAERRNRRRRSTIKNMNDITKNMIEDKSPDKASSQNNEKLLSNNETGKPDSDTITTRKDDKPSLVSTLLSVTCLLHLYWIFIHVLRFVTFIGFLNLWIEDILDSSGEEGSAKEEKVSSLLGVFSYITLGAVLSALLCGFIYDWQRNRLMGAGKLKRTYHPVVLPMTLVILYSTSVTVLCYLKHHVTMYLAFIMFTFFRSSLFTVALAFFGEAFPLSHFGVLFGFVQCAAGVAGLLQYPLFEWAGAYAGSLAHVNILLLCFQVSTIIHPIILYIRGSRDRSTDQNPLTLEYQVTETK